MNTRWARITIALLLAAALRADVKTQEKSQIHFEGMLGRMMGLFGGRAMREGVVNTVAVRGARKMTVSDTTGQIIDLGEEKIYELDLRGKSYRVITFDEMRRRMQEAQEKAAQQRRSEAPAAEKKDGQKEVEVDFSLKESGEKKTINGYDCREVVMTVTVREKGKTLEQGGGMVMTSNLWLGPDLPALKEIQEFDRQYAQKMAGPFVMGDAASAPQMAAAVAMYPMLKDALGKFQAENVNMKGAAILTVMRMETVQSAEQAASQQQQQRQESESSSSVTSVRGIGGLIGKRIARRKTENDAASSAGGSSGNRATLMTMNHELLSVATSVGATDVAIPAGFRERK